MIIRMPQPWRHPQNGIWYYRARIPEGVSAIVSGQKLSVEVGGKLASVKLSGTVKVSLRTKNESEARSRHASVSNQIEKRWALARQQSPQGLTQREIITLAGIWYREILAENEAEPGEPEGWEAYREPIIEALNYFDLPEDGVPPRSDHNPGVGLKQLGKLFAVDDFLVRLNLSIDRQSRDKLLHEIALTALRASETLERRSLGDYGPDENASRFPAWPPSVIPVPDNKVSLIDLFEGWVRETRPSRSTIDQWRKYIETFAEFIGHQDAARVTKADVLKWKEHLLEIGNTAKTISGSKLAALGVIYGWGIENDRVSSDPTQGVKVRKGKKAGEKMGGFTLSEATTILNAAILSADPACHWVPLLCAQSGARVGEVCQLRAEDIGNENGIWFMDIRAEAGSVKNASSERRVPLHPFVIDTGFLGYVKATKAGPLFYDPGKKRRGTGRPPAKIVRQKVAKWVHSLGLKVGLEHRKAPNHAWRHTFRTQGREAGVSGDVLDAIEGHAPSSEGQRYGSTSLRAMLNAIEKIGLPGLTLTNSTKSKSA
jgi:integrase